MELCADCGTPLRSQGSVRCRKCAPALTGAARRIDLTRFVYESDECIDWPYATRAGYGILRRDGKLTNVDRVIWELVNGPIRPGLQLDHLCRRPMCVNVKHLEVVTPSENCSRKAPWRSRASHCPRGHEFTPENTWIRPDRGHRVCRVCAKRPGGDPTPAGKDFVVIGDDKGALFVHHLQRGFLALVDDLEDFSETLTRENTIFLGHALDRYTPTVRLYHRA